MNDAERARLESFWDARYRDFSLSESGWRGAGDRLNDRLYACKAQVLRSALAARGITPATVFSVLDAGCGQGFFADLYAREYAGSSYSGVDLSPRLIAHLRATRLGTDFHVGDIARWRHPSGGQFDVIQSFEVLHLIIDDQHLLDAIRALSAQLAPGGFMLVTAALPETSIDRAGYLRYRSRDWWTAALAGVRLRISAERSMYYWLPAGGPSNRYLRAAAVRMGPDALYLADRLALLARLRQPASTPIDCRMRLLTIERVDP